MTFQQTVSLPDAFWFQEGPGLRNWQFTTSGIKVLNVGNILPDGTIDLSKTDRHVSIEEFQKKYSHFAVDAGDLVIASSGISFDQDGLLRTKIAFVEESHLPLCMNTSTIRFKALEGRSDLNYLRHWLQSKEFREQVSRLVTGSAQLNFGPSHLKQMSIKLPPLEEQKRIAAILDQADALRRLRRRALDRLNALGHVSFNATAGRVEWNGPALASLCMPIKSCNPATLAPDGLFDYIDIASVGKDSKSLENVRVLKNSEAPSRARQMIQKGDVLVSTVRPNLNGVAIVPSLQRMTLASTGFCVLRANPAIATPEYIFRIVLSRQFVGKMVEQATGASYPAVSDRIVKDFLTPAVEFNTVLQVTRQEFIRTMLVQKAVTYFHRAESLFTSLQHRAFRGEL